jgi:hypothetical protein
VSQTTPIEKAAVPRVRSTTTKEPAAELIGQTPRYISQDKNEENNETRQRYNTRANASANRAFEVNDWSVEVAMMSNEIPTKEQQRSTGVSWLVEMANAVIGEDGSIMEYKHLIADPKTRATWQRSCGNEFGRLAQGMPGRVEGTNTIFFIKKSDIPEDRQGDVTYVSFVCNYRPKKEEKEQHAWSLVAME